jgi:hypothetical protein
VVVFLFHWKATFLLLLRGRHTHTHRQTDRWMQDRWRFLSFPTNGFLSLCIGFLWDSVCMRNRSWHLASVAVFFSLVFLACFSFLAFLNRVGVRWLSVMMMMMNESMNGWKEFISRWVALCFRSVSQVVFSTPKWEHGWRGCVCVGWVGSCDAFSVLFILPFIPHRVNGRRG